MMLRIPQLPPFARTLLRPLGTGWDNRTYASYEIINVATTYTIGSGQDFANLKAAADALRSLILEADITLELQENVTDTEAVAFQGMISQGGSLVIQLQQYNWTFTGTAGTALQFLGTLTVTIRNDGGTGGGDIVLNPSSVNPMTWGIAIREYAWVYLGGYGEELTIDCSSKAFTAAMLVERDGFAFLRDVAFTNAGSVSDELRARFQAFVGVYDGSDPSDFTIQSGALMVGADGKIYTSGGALTPS